MRTKRAIIGIAVSACALVAGATAANAAVPPAGGNATRPGPTVDLGLGDRTSAEATATAAAARPGLRIVDLGTLNGVGRSSEAAAINDRGVVVGHSEVDARGTATHAFAWHHGRMTDLGTLGGRNSFATDVNNRGEIVGAADDPDGFPHAFLWRSGRMIDLGTLGGDGSRAVGINDRGEVVGYSDMATVPFTLHAFRWRRGVMHDLGAPAGGYLRVFDVNNRGQLAGVVSGVPMIRQRGTVRRLTDKPGFAWAINDRGQAAGSFTDGRSFRWSRGKLVELGTLAGATVTEAQGINNRGQVVGQVHADTVDAFLWQRGRMSVLPRLAGPDAGATDINDRGQIVGYSNITPEDVQRHAVLWTR